MAQNAFSSMLNALPHRQPFRHTARCGCYHLTTSTPGNTHNTRSISVVSFVIQSIT